MFKIMFQQLRDDAYKIEKGMKELRQKIHFLINNYTYHNPDEKQLIASKLSELQEMEEYCSNFIQMQLKVQAFLKESQDTSEEIDVYIRKIINDFKLPESVLITDCGGEDDDDAITTTYVSSAENKENVTTTFPSECVKKIIDGTENLCGSSNSDEKTNFQLTPIVRSKNMNPPSILKKRKNI